MSGKGEPYHGNDVSAGPMSPQHPMRSRHGRHGDAQFRKSYQMTDEETRALQDCKNESFWYRAVPLAIGAGLLTQAMVSRGTLTTSSRFGSLPKVGFGCFFGYMVGKISYVGECKKKFLKLENSPIGEMLRKGGGFPPGQSGGFNIPAFSSPGSDDAVRGDGTGPQQSDSFSSFGQSDDYRPTLDIDTSNVKTMDNQFDFELSNEAALELEAKRPEMTKTYEDLRKENRQKHSAQYTQVLPGHYQPRKAAQAQDEKAPSPITRNDQVPVTAKPRTNVRKNQYGDDIE